MTEKRDRPRPRWHLLVGLRTGLLLGLLWSGAVAARGTSRPYHVNPGPLDAALRALARQGHIQLLYAPALTARKHSHGLDGRFTVRQALARLLRDTGLRIVAVTKDTYILRPAGHGEDALPSIPAMPAMSLPTDLEPVQVNGLELPRTELEGVGPVTVIDHLQIERSGYQTLYALLRAQPGIRVDNAPVATSESEVYSNNGLSGATGAASVNLHGLGASATLFLVDGQRMAPYGLSQGQFQRVSDLNSIPLALVQRIEILRDGASTIYGADAMAGVVNVILRKRFNGVEVSGKTGISSRGDSAQRRLTIAIGGDIGHGGHALLSVDALSRDPLLGSRRSWALPNGNGGNGGYFYLSGSQIGYSGSEGCRQFDLNAGCDTVAAAQTNLQTGLRSESVLGHIDYPFASATAYANLRWTLLHQSQQTAPATEEIYLYDPAHPLDGRTILYSFDDIGPVRDRTQARNSQLTLGLRGHHGDWDWDVHLDGQRNLDADRVHGLLRTSVLDQALADGSYQLGVHDNSPSLLAALAPTLHRNGYATRSGGSFRVDGPIAGSDGHAIRLTAGADIYRERLGDHPDPLLLSNDVFQFQPPYIRHSARWTSDAYAQLTAPLGHHVQAVGGLRFEHSQGYGWAALPRLGLKWDVSDHISLRGTWARGYRAPTLPSLNRPSSLTDNGFLIEMPTSVLPCRAGIPTGDNTALCLVRIDSTGNPSLRPETSNSFTVGIVLAPSPALGITLDIYDIHRRHEIGALPLSAVQDDPQRYPQALRRDANGVLYAIDQQPLNLGRTHLRTIDFDLQYRVHSDSLGQFTLRMGIDRLATLKRQLQPGGPTYTFAGYEGQPRTTGLAGLDWSRGAWSAAINLRYTGQYAFATHGHSVLGCPQTLMQNARCRTPSFTLADVDLGYAGWRHWALSFNVRNVFNHSPVHYGNPALSYSPAFDDVVGRYFMFGFRYRR